MNDLFSLAGKNILITGSAQGIGFFTGNRHWVNMAHK